MNIKKKITIDTSSIEVLMQEIYNDIVEQKSMANTIMRKMLSFMKTQEEMNIIGPVIKEQQKILNNCTEKKISLVKLQALLLKQGNLNGSKNGEMNGEKLDLNDYEKSLLEKLLNSSDENYSSDTETYQ
jgi:hypothetical protein